MYLVVDTACRELNERRRRQSEMQNSKVVTDSKSRTNTNKFCNRTGNHHDVRIVEVVVTVLKNKLTVKTYCAIVVTSCYMNRADINSE